MPRASQKPGRAHRSRASTRPHPSVESSPLQPPSPSPSSTAAAPRGRMACPRRSVGRRAQSAQPAFRLPFHAPGLVRLWDKALGRLPECIPAWVEREPVKRRLRYWAWAFLSQARPDFQDSFGAAMRAYARSYRVKTSDDQAWLGVRETLADLALSLDKRPAEERNRLLRESAQDAADRESTDYTLPWIVASYDLVALSSRPEGTAPPDEGDHDMDDDANAYPFRDKVENDPKTCHKIVIELIHALHTELVGCDPVARRQRYFQHLLDIRSFRSTVQYDCGARHDRNEAGKSMNYRTSLYPFDCRALASLWLDRLQLHDDSGSGGTMLASWACSPAVVSVVARWRDAFSPVRTPALVREFSAAVGRCLGGPSKWGLFRTDAATSLVALYHDAASGNGQWSVVSKLKFDDRPDWQRPWLRAAASLMSASRSALCPQDLDGTSRWTAPAAQNQVDVCLELLVAVHHDLHNNPYGHWAELLPPDDLRFGDVRPALIDTWERRLGLHPHAVMAWIELNPGVKKHLRTWAWAFYADARRDLQAELENAICRTEDLMEHRSITETTAWGLMRESMATELASHGPDERKATYDTSVQSLIHNRQSTWVDYWNVTAMRLVIDSTADDVTSDTHPLSNDDEGAERERQRYVLALDLLWACRHDLEKSCPQLGRPFTPRVSYFRELLTFEPIRVPGISSQSVITLQSFNMDTFNSFWASFVRTHVQNSLLLAMSPRCMKAIHNFATKVNSGSFEAELERMAAHARNPGVERMAFWGDLRSALAGRLRGWAEGLEAFSKLSTRFTQRLAPDELWMLPWLLATRELAVKGAEHLTPDGVLPAPNERKGLAIILEACLELLYCVYTDLKDKPEGFWNSMLRADDRASSSSPAQSADHVEEGSQQVVELSGANGSESSLKSEHRHTVMSTDADGYVVRQSAQDPLAFEDARQPKAWSFSLSAGTVEIQRLDSVLPTPDGASHNRTGQINASAQPAPSLGIFGEGERVTVGPDDEAGPHNSTHHEGKRRRTVEEEEEDSNLAGSNKRRRDMDMSHHRASSHVSTGPATRARLAHRHLGQPRENVRMRSDDSLGIDGNMWLNRPTSRSVDRATLPVYPHVNRSPSVGRYVYGGSPEANLGGIHPATIVSRYADDRMSEDSPELLNATKSRVRGVSSSPVRLASVDRNAPLSRGERRPELATAHTLRHSTNWNTFDRSRSAPKDSLQPEGTAQSSHSVYSQGATDTDDPSRSAKYRINIALSVLEDDKPRKRSKQLDRTEERIRWQEERIAALERRVDLFSNALRSQLSALDERVQSALREVQCEKDELTRDRPSSTSHSTRPKRQSLRRETD